MFIKEFRITNFKSFKNVTFHFNRDMNIFTGLNNAGKTTTIEALSLWVECFLKLCRRAEKADQTTGLKRGFFRLGYQKQNYFEKLTSVHLTHHRDIFHQLNSRDSVGLEAVLEQDGESLVLGFEIIGRGLQYEIKLKTTTIDYARFNDFFNNLPRAIMAAYARPVAYLEAREEFQTPPKIQAMEDAHRAVEVTRNRIARLSNETHFEDFLRRLSYILTQGTSKITMTVFGRIDQDIELRVMVEVGNRDTPKEIALLGSGALQIITILLGCYEPNLDLNLILLDEPDSHIHRDIQKRLLYTLQQYSGNSQVFLTTHNESLIRNAETSHLFHLENRPTNTYRPIIEQPQLGEKKGFQPRPEWAILRSLGNPSALEFVSALEADRLYIVEGEDDAVHLNLILPQARIAYKERHMFWSIGGIDEMLRTIGVYKDIFSQIRNKKSLWEKSILIMDKDWLTDDQRVAQNELLEKALGIPVHVWSAYTFESLWLQDLKKLARLLGSYLQTLQLEVIEQALKTELQNQIGSLQLQIKTEAYQNDLFHRLKKRREWLIKLSKKPDVIPDDGKLLPRFNDYANQCFANGRLDHLATKEVFFAVLKPVIEAHGKNPDDVTMEDLLGHLDSGSFLPEWQMALFPAERRS